MSGINSIYVPTRYVSHALDRIRAMDVTKVDFYTERHGMTQIHMVYRPNIARQCDIRESSAAWVYKVPAILDLQIVDFTFPDRLGVAADAFYRLCEMKVDPYRIHFSRSIDEHGVENKKVICYVIRK